MMTMTAKNDEGSKVELPENRVYILNEGSYQKNNAGITYYDPDKRNNVIDDIFYKQNEAKLGDTGQDMINIIIIFMYPCMALNMYAN